MKRGGRLPPKRAKPRRKAHPVNPLPERDRPKRSPEADARRHERTERQRDERMDFRARVLAATPGGFGDCHGSPACAHLGPHRGDDPHHLHPRGIGGGGGTNATSNGRWLCRAAHDWAHANPAAAYELDLLRTWSDPWPPPSARMGP